MIWLIHWCDPQGFKGVSVQMFALLLPIFGILTVAYHGMAGIKRAIFLVVVMECALWTAYWLAISIFKENLILLFWLLVLSIVGIFSLFMYNLKVMAKTTAKRQPQERIEV
jgi:hypothetical protein